ncbi:MAG: hypothetical protein WBB85_21480, partial [Albidovulum sp.]|uniref:hypothetical protein n=1 Tax=Albidovulum sp. TaxID=1872424 RepID=UPI003CBC15FD
AESTIGGFGASAYLASISGRFVDQQASLAAEKERNRLRAIEPRDHLPYAPEGWTRAGWDDAAKAFFGERFDLQKDPSIPDEIKNDPTIKALGTVGKAVAEASDAREIYVYQKSSAVIAIRLEHLVARPGGIQGVAIKAVEHNIEAMSGKDPFALVKGVFYREELGLFGMAAMEERKYKVITGQIGSRLRISIRAAAEDGDILTLLNMIDYDTLNAMLDTPLPGIGSDAPVIAMENQRAEAERRVSDANLQQSIKHRAAELEVATAALEMTRERGMVSDEDHALQAAEIEKMRTELNALIAEGAGQAPTEPAIPGLDILTPSGGESAAEDEGGGVFAMLKGLVGGGRSDAVEDAQDVSDEAGEVGKVKITRGGRKNCGNRIGTKHCKLGE